jgi:CheY-like chemotaxis protein
MTERSQLVTFYLTCSEPRAWLAIHSDSHKAQIVEMWKGYVNQWSASVWLAQGQYRCRHYSGDNHLVTYCGPARISGSIDEGLDGLVSVKLPRDTMNSEPTNILVVEDNLTTLVALESFLQSEGYEVHIADGYQTALQVAKLNRVDFAICDINLWDGDGCDLLVELKKMQTMKAIAVTGYTLPEETEHYRDAGFASVLHKPVQYSEILSAITSLNTVPQDLAVFPKIDG